MMEYNIDKILDQIKNLDIDIDEEKQIELIRAYKNKNYNTFHNFIMDIVIKNGKIFNSDERTKWTAWLSDKINHNKIKKIYYTDNDIIKYAKVLVIILLTQALPDLDYKF